MKHNCDIDRDMQYALVQKVRAVVLCPKSGGTSEPLHVRTYQCTGGYWWHFAC